MKRMVVAICLLAGCGHSDSKSQPGSSQHDPNPTASAPGDDTEVKLDCTKDVTTADVSDLLLKPITVATATLGTGCTFSIESHPVVTVTVMPYDDNRWEMMKSADRAQPLAGIGDKAAYGETSDGVSLLAMKGPLLCYVSISGWDSAAASDMTKLRGEAAAQRLGKLCAKVFSR